CDLRLRHSFPTRRSSDLLTTRAESGGDGSGLSLTNDYDGDIRAGETGYTGTGSNPDIGADEFEGTVAALTDIAVIGLVTPGAVRSEEHTSELQSRENLVC